MPKLTTNGWTTREALMDREPFTTHGALSAVAGPVSLANVWPAFRPYASVYETHRDQIVYTVMSYNTPIGWVLDSGLVVIPPVKYSITTSGHQGMLYALDVARLSFSQRAAIRDSAEEERQTKRDLSARRRETSRDLATQGYQRVGVDAYYRPDPSTEITPTMRMANEVTELAQERLDRFVSAREAAPVDYAPVRMEYSDSYSERQGWASGNVRAFASGVHQSYI